MAQEVFHYLVDWTSFCRTWEEEENPDDALEGAERCSTHDDYFSSVARFRRSYRQHRGRAPRLDLDDVVAAFCDHYPARYRDLDDDFAYEEGGFTVVMAPENVTRVVGLWKTLAVEDVEADMAKTVGGTEAQALCRFLGERVGILERASQAGRAYVARVG